MFHERKTPQQLGINLSSSFEIVFVTEASKNECVAFMH